MSVLLAIYSAIAVLALFVAVGIYLVARSLRVAAREQRLERGGDGPDLTMSQRVACYVGPVKPEMALLNPVARVGIELFCALCGFPGLGWLISGRVAVGLFLFTVVPIFTWAVYPLYLAMSNQILAGPLVTFRYLPFLALFSAGLLAYSQAHAGLRRRSGKASS
ncbi:MAG: hypothetical protein ACYC6B_08670 [Thermoleophilia bacterium]